MQRRPPRRPGQRVQWPERWDRDWTVFTTPLGGRLRDHDLLGRLPESGRRALSPAWVAHNLGPVVESAGVAFWVSVCRKIVQRGDMPPVPPAVESALLGDIGAEALTDEELLAAVVGPGEQPVDLEPAVELHPQWEQPLWDHVCAELPGLTRWLTPQPSLEALAGANGSSQRWADFLLCTPWAGPDVVIEIDGSGHARRQGVDRDRDQMLARTGLRIVRSAGAEALDPDGLLLSGLRRRWESRPKGEADPARMRLVHGPAAFHRLVFAFVEGVAHGALPAGGPWRIEIHSPAVDAELFAGHALALLAAVDDVWDTGVVPDEVTIGSTVWHRDGTGGFRAAGGAGGAAAAQLFVRLEPFTAPHQQLGEAPGPTVVVRGGCLPVTTAWRPPVAAQRRTLVDGDRSRRGLTVLAEALFGHGSFRPGQEEALVQVLSGGDCVVLLPTSAGKSLVYQLAGLLQPGTTLVVDPIVSLIDDQERRLRTEGVDRVEGIHSGRLAGNRDAVFAGFASGVTLFAFLTPERLQSAVFRGYLRQVAASQTVNLVVVDEAHCVSEWGHDFRTSYLRLGRNLRIYASGDDDRPPPLLALTGTASPTVLRDVLRELAIDPTRPGALQRPAHFDRPNLHYRTVATTPPAWKADISGALSTDIPAALNCDPEQLVNGTVEEARSGLIFVPHVNGDFGVLGLAAAVREILKVPDPATVDVYSGEKPSAWGGRPWGEHKVDVARRFIGNETSVLVATKAFGMGIDKPNIRWTVHASMPSSIEAFAQESGRAGRDGADAICVLLAPLPDAAEAEPLLDPRTDRADRLAAFQGRKGSRDAVQQQLYFLYSSFPGAATELVETMALYRELQAEGAAPAAEVTIPRLPAAGPTPEADGPPSAGKREKALYRLSLLGLVFDYTVEHGANTFTVELANYSTRGLDHAVLGFTERVDPGRQGQYEREVGAAPAGFDERVEHHLRLVLRLVYEKIELGRLNALRSMYRLVADELDDAGVRATINGYLGEGAVSAVLSEAARVPRVNMAAALASLDGVAPGDPFEWAAAADRMLESYPGHPVVLLVRAVGEAFKPSGVAERDAFATFVQEFAGSLAAYEVSENHAAGSFWWALAQVRRRGGQRRAWCAVLWELWDRAGYSDVALQRLEDRVLAEAAGGNHHPDEIVAVLDRRLRRLAVDVAAYAEAIVP